MSKLGGNLNLYVKFCPWVVKPNNNDEFFQVKAIGMESFEKLFALNSDMSVYLPACQEVDVAETTKISEKVRGHAKQTIDTLEQVIAAIPDMSEVFNVMTRLKKQDPSTSLIEVIGPVFCNTTRHFLLIQVWQYG